MKRLYFLARIAASVIALGVVVARTDVGALTQTARAAEPVWIVGAIVINCIAVCGSTALWRTMLAPGEAPSYASMCRTYFAGMFVNNIGFGTTLGDAMRGGELVRTGTSGGHAIVTVLAERLISLVALCSLASVGAIYFFGAKPRLTVAIWLISLGVLVLVGAVAPLGRRVATVAWLPARLRGIAVETSDALGALIRRPRALILGFGIALAVQLCTVGAAVFVMRSLGVRLSVTEAAAVVPLIAICVLLPISIQGIGVREATYVYCFGLIGVSEGQALSAALISYGTTLFVSLIGAWFLLHRVPERGEGRDDAPHEEASVPLASHHRRAA